MAKVSRCPNCGRLVAVTASTCKYCGVGLASGGDSVSKPTHKESRVAKPEVLNESKQASPTVEKSAKNETSQDIAGSFVSGFSSLKSKAGKKISAVSAKEEKTNLPAPAPAPVPTPPPPSSTPFSSSDSSNPTAVPVPTTQTPAPPTHSTPPAQNTPSTSPTPPTPPISKTPATPPASQQTNPAPTHTDEPIATDSSVPIIDQAENDGIPEYDYPKKSHKGWIIGIAIALILVGGGIAAFLLLGNNESSGAKNPKEQEEATAEDTSSPKSEEKNVIEMEEIDPVRHYTIKTILSGYPITIYLDITPENIVSGKYAYDSTISKYGDNPSSWFSLSGIINDDKIFMEASLPDYGVFEQWQVTLKGNKDNAFLSGETFNYNTEETLYVGSHRPKKSPSYDYDEYYDDSMDTGD